MYFPVIHNAALTHLLLISNPYFQPLKNILFQSRSQQLIQHSQRVRSMGFQAVKLLLYIKTKVFSVSKSPFIKNHRTSIPIHFSKKNLCKQNLSWLLDYQKVSKIVLLNKTLLLN